MTLITNMYKISYHPFQNIVHSSFFPLTCIVTSLSSTMTSLVRKSAPIVALYCDVNFLLTYWFISDVLPTLCVCVGGGGMQSTEVMWMQKDDVS